MLDTDTKRRIDTARDILVGTMLRFLKLITAVAQACKVGYKIPLSA